MSELQKDAKKHNAFELEKINSDLLPGLLYLAEEAQKAGLDDVFAVLNKAVHDIYSVMKVDEITH